MLIMLSLGKSPPARSAQFKKSCATCFRLKFTAEKVDMGV